MEKKYNHSQMNSTIHISEAIDNLLNTYRIKVKFDEADLIASWKDIVGKPIAKRTKRMFIRNKILFIELESPSLKNNVTFLTNRILELLQQKFGKEAVEKIVLM